MCGYRWQDPLFLFNRLLDIIFSTDLIFQFSMMYPAGTYRIVWVDTRPMIVRNYLKGWLPRPHAVCTTHGHTPPLGALLTPCAPSSVPPCVAQVAWRLSPLPLPHLPHRLVPH